MVRPLLFLALICLVALGFTWLAGHPGQVGLTWQGYHIETSLMVATVSVVLTLAVLIALLYGIVRSLGLRKS